MIHFFPTFSKDVADTPFATELAALGVPHRLFSGEVVLRYRSRFWLLCKGWPKLLRFALKSAIRSLLLSKPYPDTVVVGSHLEALVFVLLRMLLVRRKPEIVLLGFIYTTRRSAVANRLRSVYFRMIFLWIDKVICHSAVEVQRYRTLFKTAHARFIYIPYGLHIYGRDRVSSIDTTGDGTPYILTAGRSGRDYATLFEAVAPLPIDLHVVCDNDAALAGLLIPSNVRILRNCYDTAYVDELQHAQFVVIPLAVNDISAGQMVLIQAMALAKASIITRTATVQEYVEHGEQALLVTQHSVTEMRDAIGRLLNDQQLVEKLAANAVATYDVKFCMKAYVEQLIKSVTAPATPPASSGPDAV